MAKTKEEVQTVTPIVDLRPIQANGKGVDLFERYAVDLKAEKDGRWFYDFPVQGLDLFLARANNPRFQELYTKKLQELRDVAEAEQRDVRNEDTATALRETIAETVCLDWGGTHGMLFEGEILPYTIANSLRVFTHPQMRDFADEIWQKINDGEQYRKRAIERDEKNSQRRSAGD